MVLGGSARTRKQEPARPIKAGGLLEAGADTGRRQAETLFRLHPIAHDALFQRDGDGDDGRADKSSPQGFEDRRQV